MIKVHFNSPLFDSQLLRALSYSYYKGAESGECLTIASCIKEGSSKSWHKEWYAAARRLFDLASLSKGPSARDLFFRASNYSRASMFFLYKNLQSKDFLQSYALHVDSFEKALSFLETPFERVKIPFEGTFLEGYFYSGKKKGTTIIANGGYDGTHQESYFAIGAAAIENGYNVLCFDGPGQGHALIKDSLFMRPNWESVITPVVDYLVNRQDTSKDRLVLIGNSWGGYLAPRAAAFEKRLAALIPNPGQYDVMRNIAKNFPLPLFLFRKKMKGILNYLLKNKMAGKMAIHGLKSPYELFESWENYSLVGIAEKISCPTLVVDTENECLSRGQAKELYHALKCQKEYLLFKNEEGAGEHCEAGASSLFHRYAFDWLDRILAKNDI